jgi:hypothetical protein
MMKGGGGSCQSESNLFILKNKAMPRLALFLALAALLVCASLAAPSTSHAAAAKTGSGLSTSGLDVLAEVRSILGLTSQDAVDRATVASVLQRLAVWIESQLPAAAITEMRETVAAKLRADPTPQAPSVEFGFIPLCVHGNHGTTASFLLFSPALLHFSSAHSRQNLTFAASVVVISSIRPASRAPLKSSRPRRCCRRRAFSPTRCASTTLPARAPRSS